jgi:hypothetical protein
VFWIYLSVKYIQRKNRNKEGTKKKEKSPFNTGWVVGVVAAPDEIRHWIR